MTEIGRVRLRRCSLSVDAVLRARAEASLEGLPLCPKDAFVLSRFDGTLTIQQVVDASGLSSDEALEAIARLIELGVLEQPSPTSGPPVSGR